MCGSLVHAQLGLRLDH